MGGDQRSHRLEAHAELILGAVGAKPDITVCELQALLAGHGVKARYGTVWNLLDRHGLTFKKRTAHAAEQERTDVAEARLKWREALPILDPARLVFLDESGVKTNMARLRRRAPSGPSIASSKPSDTSSIQMSAGIISEIQNIVLPDLII